MIPTRILARLSALGGCIVAFACADHQPVDPITLAEPRLESSTSGPSPLVCPTDQTKSAAGVIGTDGGEVGVAGHKVTIPAGVLSEPTEIVLTVPASQHVEIDLSAAGQSEYTFSAPVTVTISYSRCSSAYDAKTLAAWFWNTATDQLLEYMGGTDSKSARAVTFTTDHFSGYVIAN